MNLVMRNFCIHIILLSLIFFSCEDQTGKDNKTVKSGGIINIGLLGSTGVLFPLESREFYCQEISTQLLSPALIDIDIDGNAEKLLASGWKIGKNNRSIVYFLDDQFRWCNGRKVNAFDVVTSARFIQENIDKINTKYKLIRLIEPGIIDSFTVIFNFNADVGNPFQPTHFPVFPLELFEKSLIYDEVKNAFLEDFCGCGPFLLTSFNQDEIILSKNPHYPDGRPYLDQIRLRYFNRFEKIRELLQMTKLDVALSVPNTDGDKLVDLAGYEQIFQNERGFTFIGWNLETPQLSSARIRRALSYALDRTTMADGILAGYARIQDTPIFPDFFAYYDTRPLPYDPREAQKLLRSAGWDKNGAGVYLKNGQVFSINLITNAENPIRKSLTVNIKAYYRTIGIETKVEILPWQKMMYRLSEGSYDAFLSSWTASSALEIPELFKSSSILSGINYMRFADEEIDRLLDEAIMAEDKGMKQVKWIEFQKRIIELRPVTVLFNKRNIHLVSEDLNIDDTDAYGLLKSSKDWYLINRQ